MRRENLTIGRVGRGDGRDHERRGDAGADWRACSSGLTMKGERPAEIVGLARTMRAQRRAALEDLRRCVRYLRHGRRPFGHLQHFVGGGAGGGGGRAPRRQAWQPLRLEPVRQRGRVRSARRQHRGGAGLGRALVSTRSGIAFFFAPTFHPSMRHAAPVRRELAVRTAFNLLGPLTNPAGTRDQLVGVPHSELTELIARALLLLGSERAWVVHGADGIDEMSTTGHTKVSECRNGASRRSTCIPSDFGLPEGRPEGSCRAEMPPRTRRSFATFWPARRDRGAMSCC